MTWLIDEHDTMTYMYEVKMWNRLDIPYVMQVFTVLKIALMQMKPTYPV